MKRTVLIVLAALISVATSYAQYNPPAGGADLQQFYSPLFLSTGESVTSSETPEADTLNPAVSGANQRSVLDLSYIGITGFNPSAGNGWLGHAANIGVSFPSSAGVFSGSLHLLSSFLPAMQLGNNLGARFSFSKDLYPYLLVGVGLNFDVGGLTTTDFGASADLGMLMLPGTIGPLQDFRWGVALRNIGRSYTPVAGYSAIPAPFTPAIGAAFNAVKTQDLRISLNSDLSFPSFQDVRLALGGTVSLFNTVSLNAGWQADLHSLINPASPQRSLLPTFGVSVTFKTDFKGNSGIIAENGWNQSEVHTHFAAAPLYGGDWGFGGGIHALLGVIDNTPPAVTVDYPRTLYISPNNDGTQDALDLPITITDQRYVMGYDLKITDAAGNLVRDIRNKDSRPENRGFQNVVDRLLAVKRGIDVPKMLRWDGTADSGSIVKDGEYGFSLEAWDDNGNIGRTPVYHVMVDDTPPSVSIVVPNPADTIFSPNGDGNKDTFTILQSGSSELLWTAAIRNSAGKVVLTHTWHGEPTDFTWDGRATDGVTVPDGVYDYTITSTDLAGNRGSAVLNNIIVNTEATPIKLTIDNRYFSPNGDGVKDTVTFTPVVPVRSGIDTWTLDIIDAKGTTVRELGGNGVPPEHIVFNGMGSSGTVLPEATYHATLALKYQNGNQPNDTSPPFTLQLTPPNAAVTDNYSVFSPNGDGNKDTITFFQETSPATEWTGTVRSAAGKVMKTFTWPGTADLQTVWDGRGNDGALVPDGEYTYQLTGSDAAGNNGSSNTLTFSINTEATPVLLSAQYEAFSPNSDGVKDTIQLIPRLKKNDGITAYTLSILDSAGKSVRTMTGNGSIAGPFTWDGQNNAGVRAPDGMYTAELSVQYVNGNQEIARTAPFALDTVYPTATLSADYTLFSPDGDGHRDTVTIHQTTSDETLWQGKIVNDKGQEVRTVYWKGSAGDLIWDGTDDAGNKVPDGTYRYTLSAEDRAGNRTEKSIDLQVDTRPASVFVTVGTPGFSPNGDGVLDTEKFSMYVNLLDGVTKWSLQIIKQADGSSPETVVRQFNGTTVTPSFSVTWDGKSSDGKVLEGKYRARFEVDYLKGNQPVAQTPDFVLNITPPKVDLSIGPLPFSPDNDGVNDELHIKINETDVSDIRQWRFEILDRNNRYFTDFSGTGRPSSELVWDGRAKDGELVISAEDYPYVFTITDVLGNTTVKRGIIPVDILVIREGDQLKVRINSITFTPNSPELILDNSTERGVKNNEILNRLAQIFAKYSSYKIRIEGHAVNISGTAREQQQELIPLSLARAQSVKDALVKIGLSASRISVAGLGDENPIVPDTDLENRWKNRRVEFILIK